MSPHEVYLLSSEGIHIVSTTRRHQLGDIISESLVHGTSNKMNTPYQLSVSWVNKINLHKQYLWKEHPAYNVIVIFIL